MRGVWQWCMEAASTHREQTPDTPPPPPFWHLISCKRAGLLAQEQWGQVAAVVLMQHPSDIYQTKALGAFQAAAPLGAHAFWGEHRRNQRKIPSWSPGPHVKWSSCIKVMAKCSGNAPNSSWTEHSPNLWRTQSKGGSIRSHQTWPPSSMPGSPSWTSKPATSPFPEARQNQHVLCQHLESNFPAS